MARHYTTKDFFRQMPNVLLARYFQGRGLLGDLDFSAMKEGNPDTLFAAWLNLPDAQRNERDAEFREIFELSCEKGFRAIIDEAEWHLANDADARTAFVEKLAALSNHFVRAHLSQHRPPHRCRLSARTGIAAPGCGSRWPVSWRSRRGRARRRAAGGCDKAIGIPKGMSQRRSAITGRARLRGRPMKFRIVVHEAEEGGYWAEVPALPGCMTQGETMEELKANVREAIEVCLEVLNDHEAPLPGPHDKSVQLLDIAM